MSSKLAFNDCYVWMQYNDQNNVTSSKLLAIAILGLKRLTNDLKDYGLQTVGFDSLLTIS